METDDRTFGELFYACREEAADISFMEALYLILTVAADQLRKLCSYYEKTATVYFEVIMDTALQCIGLSKSKMVYV